MLPYEGFAGAGGSHTEKLRARDTRVIVNNSRVADESTRRANLSRGDRAARGSARRGAMWESRVMAQITMHQNIVEQKIPASAQEKIEKNPRLRKRKSRRYGALKARRRARGAAGRTKRRGARSPDGSRCPPRRGGAPARLASYTTRSCTRTGRAVVETGPSKTGRLKQILGRQRDRATGAARSKRDEAAGSRIPSRYCGRDPQAAVLRAARQGR